MCALARTHLCVHERVQAHAHGDATAGMLVIAGACKSAVGVSPRSCVSKCAGMCMHPSGMCHAQLEMSRRGGLKIAVPAGTYLSTADADVTPIHAVGDADVAPTQAVGDADAAPTQAVGNADAERTHVVVDANVEHKPSAPGSRATLACAVLVYSVLSIRFNEGDALMKDTL